MFYALVMQTNGEKRQLKVAIYGGNGFVGSHIAKEFASRQVCTICLSRTGHKPVHLRSEPWSDDVRWCKGDASKPNPEFLESVDALVVSVGSPPLPTFSQAAYDYKVFMNGTTNVSAIQAATQAGVKHLVLLGAQIPFPMRSDKFAYTKGKDLAYQAAKDFSQTSSEHRATVLQPGAIFGTRHLASGKAIPLGIIMKPLSYLMPWQFISVQRVAQRVVSEILDPSMPEQRFSVLNNTQI